MKSAFLIFLIVYLTNGQYLSFNNRVNTAESSAVVCSSPEAALAGLTILKQGGNAYDAAVTVAFVMAVTYPQAGNIGGGGFLIGRTAKNDVFSLDYRETAPMSAYKDMYLDKHRNPIKNKSTYGYTSAGVPGTVDGFWKLHQKYGSLPWKTLLASSIELAENGFPISEYLAYSLNKYHDDLVKNELAKQIFTKQSPYKKGDVLIQKKLARTLKQIAENGRDEFYLGETAKEIVRSVKQHGGFIELDDLKEYTSKFRDPIRFSYNNHEIVSMPPPSSGGVALYGILKSLERYNLTHFPYGSAKHIQLYTEICRRIYADRSEFLGDPDFNTLPLNKLLSKSYIDKIVSTIKLGETHLNSDQVNPNKSYVYESKETTHFNIIDKHGNCVSNTYTLNSSYGSKVVAGNTGILLNNEMDDFSIKPGVPNLYGLLGNEKNAIEPQKRMLSSMTPTLVLKENKPYFIVGSPGGSTIITTVAQAISRVIDYNFDVDKAVNLPRVHHQWFPDHIMFESGAISFDSQERLKSWNYTLKEESVIGDCHGILIDNGKIGVGVSDRGNGAVATD